jgi:hypothetical protein
MPRKTQLAGHSIPTMLVRDGVNCGSAVEEGFTLYNLQFLCYVMAIHKLSDQHPELNMGNVNVYKIDSFQGGETLVTIVDLTVTHASVFLVMRLVSVSLCLVPSLVAI